MHEIQRLLEKHPDFNRNIENAFKETFLRVNSSLKDEPLIEPLYAGTTACVALLRDKELVLSNAGDSRAVLARKIDGAGDGSWDVIDLTEDQNPDLPAEKGRIERMGGYVSPPPEPGGLHWKCVTSNVKILNFCLLIMLCIIFMFYIQIAGLSSRYV